MATPNFVIFMTDDQGYGDLSCMGSDTVLTPHLDTLAASGARFTDWYSNSPVCSPSRAALLTGRYPGNAGVRSILAGHRTASGLPPTVPTLAEALRPLGYRSFMAGKWHLGLAPGSRPGDHGFDRWYGFMAGCVDYYSHIFYWGMNQGGPGNDPTHDLWLDGREIYENGRYLTHSITERAVEFIAEADASEAPFFLFVPYNAPHYPMHAPAEYLDRFPDLPPDRRIMAAMLAAVDDGVGRVMSELESRGMRESTCVFFMSDNGPSRETRNWLDGTPDPYYGGDTGRLRGHKFSLFEGGIRSPAIMSWPGVVPAGQVIREPGAAMDVFPTLLKAAGGETEHYELDGVDFMPVLTRGESTPHHRLFWEMGGQTAVRQGNWKLVLNGQLLEGLPPEDEVHLADLERDMAESCNLSREHPEVCSELTSAAQSWRRRMEARWQGEWLPAVNGTTGRTQGAQ